MSQSSSFVVIPARLASTRLPRKLLLRDTGKSVLRHTYEAVQQAKLPRGVCVGVDHAELFEEVRSFGGQALYTREDHASGTDRVAEVAEKLSDAEIIVNVQADEPEISGEAIDLLIQLLQDHPEASMATLSTPIRSRSQLHDPSCVKVVRDELGRAMYFSRASIPFARQWHDELLEEDPPLFYQHLGIYAYRRSFLLELAKLPPAPLELVECLEQLRVLSAGYTILVGELDEPTIGIDTEQDYQAFVNRVRCG
ncbi:3-deoxy-manno-octulosonate cytidylyltransferase [Planctomycetales bacterium 10988]|nr:3-deoxy-manno-octulosonate cytidylyltransferase [Planctomycetales bacterium 10988]